MAKKAKILIIEPSERLCGQLDELLSRYGYMTKVATSSREGLALIKDEKFDLVLTETKFTMETISSLEHIQGIRDLDKSVLLFILSVNDQWKQKVDGFEAGADEYVTKPFHAQEISARIANLLRRVNS